MLSPVAFIRYCLDCSRPPRFLSQSLPLLHLSATNTNKHMFMIVSYYIIYARLKINITASS
jgi:hypothetical protein